MTACRIFHAEHLKLRTLPAVPLTIAATWTAGALVEWALIAAADGSVSAIDVSRSLLGYLQVGFVVLGVVAGTSEYTGGQVRTSLISMPRRAALQAGKALALVTAAAPAAALAVLGSALAATFAVRGQAPPDAMTVVRHAAGATAYLVLTTLIAAAVATVIRAAVPSVAILLGYYVVIGPLLHARTTRSEYLPDGAAHRETALTYGTSALWTLAALAVATALFCRRDA